MASNEGDKITEGPNIKADTWFAIALSAFLITIVIGGFAAAWVFFEQAPALMVQRAQAFTPFGAALLAIVTFCTVAWRGVLNTQQLQQQADQLKQQIRQNDANDAANLAKLLQEGAKLIADRDKLPQVIAGISTLEMVVREPQGRFAIEAMDLLAELLVETYDQEEGRKITTSATRALAVGADLGYRSRVSAYFEHIDGPTARPRFWTPIKGLRSVSFKGGTLNKRTFESMASELGTLESVKIVRAAVEKITDDFTNCHFDRCTFGQMSVFDLTSHKFSRCNFSNTTIIDASLEADIHIDMKTNKNYYIEGQEPHDEEGYSVEFVFLTWEELRKIEQEEEDPF